MGKSKKHGKKSRKSGEVEMEDVSAGLRKSSGQADGKDEDGKPYVHPADKASCWSYATFSWLTTLMYHTYRHGFDSSKLYPIAPEDSSKHNTDILEALIDEQRRSGQILSFNRVIWTFAKRRIFYTTIVHLTCILVGFMVPTICMKKLLEFVKDPERPLWMGIFWVLMFILFEFLRVFFFTLTWAMSYRTGIRLKIASMGIIFRKITRLSSVGDHFSSILTTVISSDCSRIYDVIVSTQMAIGGPVVLILSVIYIVCELGVLPLVGLLVFPLSYPLQIFLAKATGYYKGKAISVRDNRITFLTQALRNMKFLKMFAWEKYYRGIIAEVREQEKRFLRRAQLLQSISICITPALPHIGVIITFLLYVNTGKELTSAQVFTIVGVFAGRLRPAMVQVRSAVRSWYDARISIERIECFTIVFLFSLFGYSIRSTHQLITFYYIYRIYIERMEYILQMTETSPSMSTPPKTDSSNSNLGGSVDPIIMDEVRIVRRAPPLEAVVNPTFNLNPSKMTKVEKKELKKTRRNYEGTNIDKLIKMQQAEVVTFRMEPLNLLFKKGSFIGVCGNIGSGKSTLLKTIAGGLPVDQGSLEINCGLVYVPQDPWIFKGSIQENILFGEPCDLTAYHNALYSCCLLEDVGTLPSGDKTTASYLSGGQKQRVSLARALYHASMKDVYLLDDPFSALDAKVGKLTFERYVNDQLKKMKKTIILATHQLQYLQSCDEILVFADGKICERGTHNELISKPNSHYSNLASGIVFEEEKVNEEFISEDAPFLDGPLAGAEMDYCEKPNENQNKARAGGKVGKDVYLMYIRNGGGYCAALFILLVFAVSQASQSFSSWWLKDWLQSNGGSASWRNGTDSSNSTADVHSREIFSKDQVISKDSPDFAMRRDVFAGLIGVILVTSFMRAIMFTLVTVKASHGLHCRILSHLFRSRVKSTEKIGYGRITNLFSKDMEEVDHSLPNTVEFFIQNIFIVLSIIIMISMIYPVFLIPFCALGLIFFFLRRVYKGAIRDLKRLEAETKTPIFTIVQEVSSGLDSIRAYGKEKQLLEKFEAHCDEYHSIYYIMISAMRWLSVRLDALAVAVTGITAALILVFRESIPVAPAGLALSYAAQLSGVFQFTVRLASETETKFICIERMKSFLRRAVLEEPELFSSTDKNLRKPENLLLIRSVEDLNQNWPFAGHVKFDSVYFSYSGKDVILKNLCFEVMPGQKIGIIGRTGSGKSSIGCALFRLAELMSGQILIDDVDISDVSLSKLRNSLCVIPQEAAIIQNSIRFNLDPGKNHTDDELWQVLEKTGLKESVELLDAEIGFSQGQRQLLSIARAILRRSKVVFIDEATASIDSETSAAIDRLLVEEFKQSTVFIVAHRQSAVRYCEYLLVLDNGEVRNFAPADMVRENENFISYFDQNYNVL